MKQIISICLLNFKEAVRNKLFLGVVFFFVFYLAFCIFLGKLSVGHTDKVLRDTGLAGIELTSVILVIFSFTLSFFKEKETRILEVYLSNFKKSAYLSGKLAGYFLISAFYLFFSAIALVVILSLYASLNLASLIALYPLFLKLAVIICFTSIFSYLFSSPVLALLSSMFLYTAMQFSTSALNIIEAHGSVPQKFIVKVCYFLLPNADKLDIRPLAVWGEIPHSDYFVWVTFYVFVYILFLWLINLFVFQKKEY